MLRQHSPSTVDAQIDPDLKEADAAFIDFKLETALRLYSRVLLRATKYPRINIIRARAHIGCGDVYTQFCEFDKALLNYQRVLMLDPSVSKMAEDCLKRAYIECANTWLRLDNHNQENQDNVMRCYIDALALDPACFDVNLLESMQAAAERHPLFPHGQALLKDSHCESAYFAYANFYLKENRYPSALFCLNKVLAINPNHTMARLLRGEFYAKKDMVNEAFVDLNHALNLDDKLASAHVVLATIYLDQDKLVLARRHLAAVLSLDLANKESQEVVAAIENEMIKRNMSLEPMHMVWARLRLERSIGSEAMKKYFSEKLDSNCYPDYSREVIQAIDIIEDRIRADQKLSLGTKGLFSQNDSVLTVLNPNETCKSASFKRSAS